MTPPCFLCRILYNHDGPCLVQAMFEDLVMVGPDGKPCEWRSIGPVPEFWPTPQEQR